MSRFSLLLLLILAVPVSAAKIVLVAGGGDGKDGSPATKAKLVTPFGCDFDSKGTLYFVEMEKGERLRRVNADSKIETAAGTGEKGSKGDQGPATDATFNGIHGLAILPDDTVLIADTWNNRIREYRRAPDEIRRFCRYRRKRIQRRKRTSFENAIRWHI